MKKRFTLTTATMIFVMAITSFGQVSAETKAVPVKKQVELGLAKTQALKAQEIAEKARKPIPTASEVLADVRDKISHGQVPAEIYPPGYFEQLEAMGDKPVYALESFDAAASALKAGDRANMVYMDPTFTMGSPTSEALRATDETQHTVTITYGFYIGKYPVTQGEYLAIVGNNPSYFTPANGYSADLNRPVDTVSWFDATNYCGLLTAQELSAGRIPVGWAYRLATEAEWEFSCRAGTSTAFHFGDIIHSGDANFNGTSEYDASTGIINNPSGVWLQRTTTVGDYDPNGWGLFDMHGNIWEWCQDWYDSYPAGSAIDPQGPVSGTYRMIRGGSFSDFGYNCRAALRSNARIPSQAVNFIGFRTVLAPIVPEWKTAIEADTSRYSLVGIGSIPSGKDSLVIITHGAIPSSDDPAVSTAWVDSMSNSIASYFMAHSINNWQVRGHKWIEGAHIPLIKGGPQTALGNARQQGVSLGYQILAQGYTHVHLIAHSAGSALIQAATDVIKAQNSSIVIHETFLDPFVGATGSGAAVYGSGANWADNYFTRDDGDTGFGDSLPFTQFIMPNTYNVDVTQLDVNNREQRDYFITGSGTSCYKTKSKHDWPISFYSNTITGTVTSDYQGYGFPLSEAGGNYSYATANYLVGNGTFGNAVALKQLGTPDPSCFLDIPAPSYPSSVSDFLNSPAVQSTTGTINKYPNGSIKQTSGSPAWLATFITVSNVANIVSFEADFQSTNSAAEGLLSVYWDNENIGSIDERVVQAGFQTYTFKFPTATSNSMHMLGFRLDPFTNIQSVVVITNVITTASGVTQPFSLAMTGVTNGLQNYQLTGQAGLEYSVQATTNFVNWKTIASLLNTNGTVQFYDKDSTNYTYRFYRAVAPF